MPNIYSFCKGTNVLNVLYLISSRISITKALRKTQINYVCDLKVINNHNVMSCKIWISRVGPLGIMHDLTKNKRNHISLNIVKSGEGDNDIFTKSLPSACGGTGNKRARKNGRTLFTACSLAISPLFSSLLLPSPLIWST